MLSFLSMFHEAAIFSFGVLIGWTIWGTGHTKDVFRYIKEMFNVHS